MKKFILALLFLSSVSWANQFTDFPDNIVGLPMDGCDDTQLLNPGCIFANQMVSMYGFRTSTGTGIKFSVDDTGALNADIVGIATRLDLQGTVLFHKADFPPVCNANGLLDLNFTGDYYVVDTACKVSGISNRLPGIGIAASHEVKLLFKDKVDFFNMQNVPQGYGRLHMLNSVDFHSGPVRINFTMDGGDWWEDGRTPY